MTGAAFDESKFSTEQIVELKASAISPDIAERAGLYSIDDPKAAAKLLGRGAKYWSGHLPVLVYPYYLPFHRDPVRYRGKPAKPFEVPQKDGSVTLAKYVEAKGSPVHLYFGCLLDSTLRDVTIPLWITEGEKKQLAAASHGLCCLAVSGVHQWHEKKETTLHPDFAHVRLEGREVFLAFDRDALANKAVRDQETALGRALDKAGARVHVVRLPENAPKLDDFLATHERTEIAALIEDAKKHGKLPPETNVMEGEWKSVEQHLRRDADGVVVKDVDNIARILVHHPAWSDVLGFNVRRVRQVLLRPPPFADDLCPGKSKVPRDVEDGDALRVGAWLVAQPCLGWSKMPSLQQLEQAVGLAAQQHRFDPVADYLKGRAWDEVPRLDAMAITYFGAKDSVYTRTVVAKWMLSAVARARTPGCQVDHVLVLEGEQGLKKSSALRILAGDEHFSDNLPLDLGTKDAQAHLLRPWIIEIPELASLKRTELAVVKAFVTRRNEDFRQAYAHHAAEHPRRCVFAATTNECTYLKDTTGDRRWWGIECTRIDLDALARDRDQLWAEALHRLRAGEAWHLTDEAVLKLAQEEQDARRERHPWEERVALLAPIVTGEFVTVGRVLRLLGAAEDDRNTKIVARILRDGLGWRRVRKGGGERTWGYVPATREADFVKAAEAHASTSQPDSEKSSATGTPKPKQCSLDVQASQSVPVVSNRAAQTTEETGQEDDSVRHNVMTHDLSTAYVGSDWDTETTGTRPVQAAEVASESTVPVPVHVQWDGPLRDHPLTDGHQVAALATYLYDHPSELEQLAARVANDNGEPTNAEKLARWWLDHPEEFARDVRAYREAAQ